MTYVTWFLKSSISFALLTDGHCCLAMPWFNSSIWLACYANRQSLQYGNAHWSHKLTKVTTESHFSAQWSHISKRKHNCLQNSVRVPLLPFAVFQSDSSSLSSKLFKILTILVTSLSTVLRSIRFKVYLLPYCAHILRWHSYNYILFYNLDSLNHAFLSSLGLSYHLISKGKKLSFGYIFLRLLGSNLDCPRCN